MQYKILGCPCNFQRSQASLSPSTSPSICSHYTSCIMEKYNSSVQIITSTLIYQTEMRTLLRWMTQARTLTVGGWFMILTNPTLSYITFHLYCYGSAVWRKMTFSGAVHSCHANFSATLSNTYPTIPTTYRYDARKCVQNKSMHRMRCNSARFVIVRSPARPLIDDVVRCRCVVSFCTYVCHMPISRSNHISYTMRGRGQLHPQTYLCNAKRVNVVFGAFDIFIHLDSFII